MIIEVTEKHIEDGIRKNCEHCPVALAVREATGSRSALVSVYPYDEEHTEIELHIPGDKIRRIRAPKIVDSFASSFDKGIEVHPFTFELDLEDR